VAVDIFRLENGKIVEHWDVIQTIPEKMAHGNTMY
jgi:predicted SnoaL-like aldol condensation-catalyzing enzyme